jgi:hypothetical protein
VRNPNRRHALDQFGAHVHTGTGYRPGVLVLTNWPMLTFVVPYVQTHAKGLFCIRRVGA